MLENPTPGRVKKLLATIAAGELTKEHIQGAMASELSTVAVAMAESPQAFKDARMGYSIRRDILTKLLDSAATSSEGAGPLTCVVVFPDRFYGPPHGDKVKTGRGSA